MVILGTFDEVTSIALEIAWQAHPARMLRVLCGFKVLLGRSVRSELRELVISFGRTGYVALYRVVRSQVEVLSIRHQREVGAR